MSIMKKTVLLGLLLFAGVYNIHAQSVAPSAINASGGTAIIGANEFDWSVGEMTMVSTFTGTGIIVTQGVLQPAETSINAVNNQVLLKKLQVYPNPATSIVNLQYFSPGEGTMTYRLMDVTGKIIANRSVQVKQGTNTEQINVAGLACATYLLEVSVNTGTEKTEKATYKIDKLK
jgi:hypothetical protein